MHPCRPLAVLPTAVPAVVDWLPRPGMAVFVAVVVVFPLVGFAVLLRSLRDPGEEPSLPDVEHCPACGTPVDEDDRLYCEDCRRPAAGYRK